MAPVYRWILGLKHYEKGDDVYDDRKNGPEERRYLALCRIPHRCQKDQVGHEPDRGDDKYHPENDLYYVEGIRD